MPELPDITVYLEALEPRILGHTLERVLDRGPSLLRTADPRASAAEGHNVSQLRRIGKRIAIGFDNDIWLVLHLMIAGTLALEREAQEARRPPHSGCISVRFRMPDADRSRLAQTRFAACGPRRVCACMHSIPAAST